MPATDLGSSCYDSTFANTGIEYVPKISAINLSSNCYTFMFSYCDKLT